MFVHETRREKGESGENENGVHKNGEIYGNSCFSSAMSCSETRREKNILIVVKSRKKKGRKKKKTTERTIESGRRHSTVLLQIYLAKSPHDFCMLWSVFVKDNATVFVIEDCDGHSFLDVLVKSPDFERLATKTNLSGEMAANISVNSHIWLEDSEIAWIDGVVLNIKGDEADVKTSDGRTIVAHMSKLYPKDVEASSSGVEDMTKLAYLHEPGVLFNLSTRYEINEIYTYTGNILIAVNPFQGLPHFYDADMMEKYKEASFGELSPHVFAVGGIAYREMVNEGRNNSILVSGESGSGKTETTKMLMRYLAYLGGQTAAEGRKIEQKVLESNPVLEAFGNAKTVKNNNSSRFGKFVEIQFDDFGRISGAAIRTYLLERSRVCQISDPERNYHCFYLLCAAPSEEIEKYKLGDPKSFHYLNQSDCYKLVGVNDAREYLATRRAMDVIGIGEKEQDAIFRVVAAILHLGNIEFAKGEEADSSFIKDEKSEFHLQMTSELLMCDPRALEDALCKRMMVTPEEVIKRSLDPRAAAVSRDGLAKTIYSRLFDWLVEKINFSFGQDPNSKRMIGVLDIYGFESFENNSFEQLCINFTNEKLQQHFNQHVFKMEQDEYQQEDIDWSYVEFVDNQDVVDLIEKKPGGIIALLDEACMLPKSTPETFSQKLYQTFKNHKRFIKPKLARSDFTVVHYAGEVQYQSDQFLDKNKDYVVAEHRDLLSASQCSFVAGFFPPFSKETSKSSKFSSIGSRFKLQLQQLMDTLNSTEPHYIRCVKPNNKLQPAIFENSNVLHQLHSGGVLEAIRVKCAGYPTRRTFIEILSRYGILAPEILKGDYQEKVACKWILEKVGLTGYQTGKTKVFLRAGQMAELDAHRTRVLGESAKLVQGQFKTYLTRKRYISMRRASMHIQAGWRGKLARKLYKDIKRDAAAIKIQKNLHRQVARKAYRDVRGSAIDLQAGFRSMAARDELRYRIKTKASVVIQAYWRCYQAVSDYKKLKRASTVYQSRYRGRNAKRQLGQLKMADVEEQKEHEEPLDLSHQTDERLDEAYALQSKGSGAAVGKPNEAFSVTYEIQSHFRDAQTIEILTAEVETLKILVQMEKQRADDSERKYSETQEISERRRKKLEETERRVYQLQDSLNRLLYSMSDQFSQLKSIIRSPSISTSTSTLAPIVQDDLADTSENSDASSSDSDFTFPTPSPTSPNFSTFSPNRLEVIVQDLSATDAKGSENYGADREGAFDDYF